ncbi:MAG: 4-hydroxythreonine-4-phosphate dehydrogenase PdxA [Clostridia bacterium]|nr:4-hydroxythreonine-4-phosphate dehydrogenase PdxA [Clostridia bacterium]
MSEQKPLIALTLGDICGIGPEITLKAAADPRVQGLCRLLAVGSPEALMRAREITSSPLRVHSVQSAADAQFLPGALDVLDTGSIDVLKAPIGTVCVEGGRSAFTAVEKAIELAMQGQADATVTNPLNKEAMNLAGYHFAGHTEIYAHFTGAKHYSMMLADVELRVVHVSTHVSLREACDRVKKDRVLEVIRLADDACRQLGIRKPRVGVAGLNPHCGEGGLFGREEIEEIAPAIAQAQAEGIDAQGPVPPDTVFSKARGGWYDIVVAMYHDQGHIPLKVLGFQYDRALGRWQTVSGVNITLGLPIIRVSVDHGTAFDQAGKNTASPESLINAIDYAARFANEKRKRG